MALPMDCALENITADVFHSEAMNGDEYVRCSRCGYGGCDVRVSGCGCTLHARCTVINGKGPLAACPQCAKPTTGLVLFPMSFREIDEARKTVSTIAQAKNRAKKRKADDNDDKTSFMSEKRTGRWTPEEMAYCDKLIAKFQAGELPLVDGIKLNDFLSNMLKSKQSRLTKKMKNAKLSTKTFERGTGHLADAAEARAFSDVEDSFFLSIQCHLQRAEVKFHMQKEWREQFSSYCVNVSQPLDADDWLSSVEEMDRRANHAKDAARMQRRKLMMGNALRTDMMNPERGVFIERSEMDKLAAEQQAEAARVLGGSADNADTEEALLSLLSDNYLPSEAEVEIGAMDGNEKSSLTQSAPFLSKVVSYIERHHVPFEHVDLWVPSFVPSNSDGSEDSSTSCRLCYAGSATAETQVRPDGKTTTALAPDDLFNFQAFGDYSQKFSFDVGCGLPGRVYNSGLPTWEQSVQNAPDHHFERCGGAVQWGIKTVVGIPIASPNVGRIVVTLYSRHDRNKDQELVARLTSEFTKLMPSPRWKLVVDLGEPGPDDAVVEPTSAGEFAEALTAATERTEQLKAVAKDDRIDQVISLLGEFMPSEPGSPHAPFLPGFMSLRLMLLRPSKSAEDEEMVRTILGSYASYTAGGRARQDIALNLSQDYMFLSSQQQQPQAQTFLGLGPSLMSAASLSDTAGFSFFGLPASATGSANASFQNSPALAPIAPPPLSSGGPDSVSIVSN